MTATPSPKWQPHAQGWLLDVRVLPGSKRDAIRGSYDGRLKIAVAAAPEKGQANRAVIALLARQLRLKRTQIEVLRGATSQDKTLLVATTEVERLHQWLEQVAD